MPLTPNTVNYVDRDFYTWRSRVFTEIRSVYPEWTDDQVANFGNILVEAICFGGDMLDFYLNNQARETRITTAELRENMIALVSVFGYAPRGQSAARTIQTFTLPAPALADVTIAAETPIYTREITSPIVYKLLADVVIPAGGTTAEGVAENSTRQELVAAPGGLPEFSVTLPSIPYLAGTLSVTDTDGAWEVRDSLLGSEPTDRHCALTVDENERATLTFGDALFGAVPQNTLTIVYRTGGGKAGRVEAGALVVLKQSFSDAFGNPVQLTTTNAERSTPAEDRESVERIRYNAPRMVRVQNRAVSREDYEISAEQVAGVARALHVTRNEIPAIEENRGVLYVVPSDGGEAPEALLDEVRARFTFDGATPSTNTYRLEIRSAIYLEIDIEARVHFSPGTPSARKSTIAAAARAALDAYMAIEVDDRSGGTVPNTLVDFGYYYQGVNGEALDAFPWSDLFNVIRDTPGISRVSAGPNGFLLNGERADVPISPLEFPRPGSLRIIDADTGEQFNL